MIEVGVDAFNSGDAKANEKRRVAHRTTRRHQPSVGETLPTLIITNPPEKSNGTPQGNKT